MTITLSGDTGITTPMYNGSITANAVTPVIGFKNKIINGACVIDQRNAGASVSVSSNTYTLDRYRNLRSGSGATGVYSVQQSSVAPAGFVNSMLMTVTTTDSSPSSTVFYSLRQSIEGFNTADLNWGTANAKTVTLSFWVRSSLTGTFGGALNNDTDLSYPFSYTISAANTWEQKSVTIAGPNTGTWLTNNGIGINLEIALGVGSSRAGTAGAWTANGGLFSSTGATNVMATNGATFYITGVQLEVGSTATSFDYRPYTTEFALCQRYYEVHGGTANAFPQYFGYGNNGTNVGLALPFAVSKRAAPTVTALGTWTVSNCGQPFADSATVQGYRLAATCSSTNTIQFYPASSSEKVTISAEL